MDDAYLVVAADVVDVVADADAAAAAVSAAVSAAICHALRTAYTWPWPHSSQLRVFEDPLWKDGDMNFCSNASYEAEPLARP